MEADIVVLQVAAGLVSMEACATLTLLLSKAIPVQKTDVVQVLMSGSSPSYKIQMSSRSAVLQISVYMTWRNQDCPLGGKLDS